MIDNGNGLNKIGRSINPNFRERTFQSTVPIVKLLMAWLAPKEKEVERHKKFKAKRVRGEWFSLSSEDISFLEKIMKDYPSE